MIIIIRDKVITEQNSTLVIVFTSRSKSPTLRKQIIMVVKTMRKSASVVKANENDDSFVVQFLKD